MNGVEYMLRDRSPRYSVAIHICHYKLDSMTNTLLDDLLLQNQIDSEVGVFLFDNGSPVPYTDGPIPAKTIYRVEKGLGLTGAFNESVRRSLDERDWALHWLLTNDVRLPNHETLPYLVNCFSEMTHVGAAQPAMPSFHEILWPDRSKTVVDVPFLEWTAPILSTYALLKVGFPDEELRFVGMDLDWSYRARQAGFRLLVDHRAPVDHPYEGTWANCPELGHEYHKRHENEFAVLSQRYGPDYLNLLCGGRYGPKALWR